MRSGTRSLGSLLLATALASFASAAPPEGWTPNGPGMAHYAFDVDSVSAEGRRSATIRAKDEPAVGQFAGMLQSFLADEYRGSRLRLTGLLRTAEVRTAQMWMRVDAAPGRVLAFDNMDERRVTGTTDWNRYEVVLDVPLEASRIYFGFFLNGKGQVWADDCRFEKVPLTVAVTGKPWPDAARAPISIGIER